MAPEAINEVAALAEPPACNRFTIPSELAANWVKVLPMKLKLKGKAVTDELAASEDAATSCVVPVVISIALLLASAAKEAFAAVEKT